MTRNNLPRDAQKLQLLIVFDLTMNLLIKSTSPQLKFYFRNKNDQ